MLKYNICFVKRGNEFLLLNRERSSWMGCWNGIGGKLEIHETPREAMIREMVEETGIADYDLQFKGLVTWSGDDFDFGGMYAYIAEVAEDFEYATPKKMDEGILDWKTLDWIMDSNNVGIVPNIPLTLPYMIKEENGYDHHCMYEKGVLQEVLHKEISLDIEMVDTRREQYLRSYSGKQEVQI